MRCKRASFTMQYVAFCSIKGYLLQKDIAKDQTKNNFIRNSSLVTSGLNFLKDNTLECDELYFKLITRLKTHVKFMFLAYMRANLPTYKAIINMPARYFMIADAAPYCSPTSFPRFTFLPYPNVYVTDRFRRR